MAKKIIMRAVLLTIVAFGIFALFSVLSLFIPRHGEATSVSDLRKVFRKAGPEIQATFTNSLVQKFPFDGTIAWRLVLFKEPLLILDGRADTNALPAFVHANAGTQFSWNGTDTNGENWSTDSWPTKNEYPTVHWKKIFFGTRHTNESIAVIDGTFDVVSNKVEFLIH